MAEKRKMQTKSYDEKYKIIKFVEEHPNMKQKDVASIYNMRPQTLSDLLRNREKIIKAVENPVDARKGSIKRSRIISLNDVESALIIWFRQYCNKPDLRIDTDMLVSKANYFCGEFGHETTVTNGWVHRFKKRYGIGKVQKAGEASGVDMTVVEEWKEGKLKETLEKYNAADIYNADETGTIYIK
jgi:hypothetical protein